MGSQWDTSFSYHYPPPPAPVDNKVKNGLEWPTNLQSDRDHVRIVISVPSLKPIGLSRVLQLYIAVLGYRFTDIPTDIPIDQLTDRHVQSNIPLNLRREYKKSRLLRCINHFELDLINNKDNIRISGTEPSSLILRENKVV